MAAVAVGAIVMLSGCGSSGRSGDGDPVTTVPDAPSTATVPPETTTATTTEIPLDRDPPVIDLAYVQRVLDQLSHLDGEASRILYREKRMTPEFESLIQTYLDGESLSGARQAAQSDLSVNLQNFRDPPADPRVTALRIVAIGDGCIAAVADSDFSPRYRNRVDVQRGIGIVLQRNLKPTEDEKRINPSNWIETLGGEVAPGKDLGVACG